MRAPCVDRDLKFKNMYLKHSEQLAAKAGGDGWGKPAVNEDCDVPSPLDTVLWVLCVWVSLHVGGRRSLFFGENAVVKMARQEASSIAAPS